MQRPAQRTLREAGFSIAELAFSLVIFLITAAVLINHLTVNYSSTRAQQDKVFAYTKAQTILSELQAYVDRGAAQAAIDLDALDDGVVNRPTLTITTVGGTLVAANHPLSGNFQRDGNWVWSRRITVRPFAGLNNRNVRYVTVQIFKRDGAGIERPEASLSSVVNSVGSAFPSTQVFDLYLLAIENIPGWWVYMDAIVPFVDSAITDLESRNPGLSLRTHWITKASYGRDPVYRPFLNEAVDSNQQVDSVYFYPGRMPGGSSSAHYYVPDLIKARISVDGVEQHGYDATLNPFPYALADFYNHAMRYPREKALHDTRVAAVAARKAAIAAAKAASLPPPADLDDMSEEPTLRLLLEDMTTNPDKYRNALVMNLHGELLPMPSLRNYSDAAKDPANLSGVRVVTHPEELRTLRDPGGAGIDDVVLRVYAYKTNPAVGANIMPNNMPIALQVMGLDLTDGAGGLGAGVGLQNLRGGVVVNGTTNYFAFANSKKAGDVTLVVNEMYYDVQWVPPDTVNQIDGYTLLRFYNTPVVAPLDGANRGLAATARARLYGLEYQPGCTEAAADFSRDLSFVSNAVPKNTARWRLRIPSTVFANARFVRTSDGAYINPAADVVLTARTRIWDPALDPDELTTGTMYPNPVQPENFSETYTWWAQSPNAVPITERSQFQGDPRHNPYKDLDNVAGADYRNGYNWYWDTLTNSGQNSAADYPALDSARLRNRWLGRMSQDVPRFFQLLRSGVVSCGAVYTTLAGFSYYYMGHGNEIGYDSANGYTNSIPVHLKPWGNAGTGFVDNITGATGAANGRYRGLVRNGLGANWWWGMTWQGELCPDAVYTTQWLALDVNGKVRGNLDSWVAASPLTTFYVQNAQTCYQGSASSLAFGTVMNQSQQRCQSEGCTTFFDIGSNVSTFHHQFCDGQTGTLVGAGLDLRDRYNFPMLTTADIYRPFLLNTNGAGGVGDEWSYAPYTTRYTATLPKTYYNHQSGAIGSGLVKLTDNADTSSAYIVVNGLSMSTASGSSFIAKFSLLSMIQSFFESGDAALTHRIKRPPQVTIQAPTEITELTDPATVDIQYDISWKRWDGQDYTSTSGGATETESEIEYVIMYSKDNGVSWLYVQDDSAATPGVKPTNVTYLNADAGAGPEVYSWSTPAASFPQGSYLLRVEAYRTNQALHYAQHQVKIYIQR